MDDEQRDALVRLRREFNQPAMQLDEDVLLSVLAIHANDVQATINFLRAGEGDMVERPHVEGEEPLPPAYMDKPAGWYPVEAAPVDSDALRIKRSLLSSDTSLLEVVSLLKSSLGVSVVTTLIHQGVEPSAPCRARILAGAYATKNYELAAWLCERPNYLFGLVEVLRALKLLDAPRKIRQLNAKLDRLVANGSKAKTVSTLRSSLAELSQNYMEAQVTSVSGSLIKRIKRWCVAIPKDHLEFFLLQLPREPWRQLADICHLAPRDFQLDWFLPVIFGRQPPEACLLNTVITAENVVDLVNKFNVPYAYLRKQVANLPVQVRERVAAYEKLEMVLWYQEELDCPAVDATIISRLQSGEQPEMPYGKLMERMMTFRAAGKHQLFSLLIPIAQERLDEINLPLEPPVVIFGDASYSMDVAIRTATIISSLLSVAADAKLCFFNTELLNHDESLNTVPQVIQCATNTRAHGLTAPAIVLHDIYTKKQVVNTMIVVTDEIENEPSNGYFFAQLFYKYYTEVNPSKLVFVSFLEDPNHKGRMVRALESMGIVPIQFRLHSGRPDLTKLDSLLGLIASETSIFPFLANQLAGTYESSSKSFQDMLSQLKTAKREDVPVVEAQPHPIEQIWVPPDDLEIPEDFVCPLTHELMREPAVAADGNTYERAAIEEWFQGHATSPMTNIPLDVKLLFPNYSLKSRIAEWILQHK